MYHARIIGNDNNGLVFNINSDTHNHNKKNNNNELSYW